MQIDFSAAFDRVTHRGILYKLCSVGVGSSVLSILIIIIIIIIFIETRFGYNNFAIEFAKL